MAYLEREFHKYNEVFFDVECWLLCDVAASLSYVCDVGHPGGGGRGVGARRKMPKTPLKLPESCFMGVSQIYFHP